MLNNLGLGLVFTAQDLASGHIARLERTFLSLDRSISGGADRIRGAFKQVGVGLSLFTAGAVTLAGAFALTTKAAEFEQAIAAVGAVSEASAEDITALENAALRMGIATQYAPTEAAKGLGELAQAGFNARQSIALLRPVLDLAAGSLGKLTPETAAGVAVQALRAFRIEADDASVAVDRMLKAANIFSMNAGELPQGLGHAAAGASALHQSLEETLTTFGLMHNIIPGVERAGSAVSVAMERMADPRTQKMLASVGLSATDAHDRFLPFLDVVKQLAPKLDAMTEKDRASFLIKAFGHHALAGIGAILEQLTRGVETNTGAVLRGGAAIDYLRGQLQNATGAAETFSKALLNTLAGQEKLLRGSVETLEILVGKSFAEVFRPVVELVLRALNTILELIQATPKPVRRIIATVVLAAAAFLTLVGSVVAAQGALAILGFALEVLGVSLGAIAATFGVAVLAVGVLGIAAAGLKVAWDRNLGGIADRASRLGEVISLVFRGLSQLIEQGGFSGAVREELHKAGNEGLLAFLVQVDMVWFRLQKFWRGIKEGFGAALEAAWPIFQELGDALDAFGAAVADLFTTFTGAAAGLPSDRFRAFGQIVGDALASIAAVAAKVLAVVLSFFSGLLSTGRQAFGWVTTAAGDLGRAFGALGAAWAGLTGTSDAASASMSGWGEGASLLGRIIGWTIGAAITGVIGLLTRAVQVVTFVVKALTVLKNAFREVGDFVSALGDALVWFFTEVLPNALASAGHAIGSALGKLGDVGAALFGLGPEDAPSAAGGAPPSGRAVQLPSARVAASSALVRAAAAASPATAAAAQEGDDAARLQSLVAAAQSRSTGSSASAPVTVNVQVDGETLARAQANASRDLAGRSYSPVPAY